MREISLLLLALPILFSANSSNAQDGEKGYPIEKTDNIRKIKKRSFGYDYYLKSPEVIQTYPCQDRFTVSHKGRLMGLQLSEDHIINEDLIPAGTKIRLYNPTSPHSFVLTRSARIQGFQASAEEPLRGPGWHVSFYEDGSLEWFRPVNDTSINGIPCEANKCVKLYPDGSLHVCTVSEEFIYDENSYKKGSNLILNKKGKASPISGIYLRDHNWMEFHENGNPDWIAIAVDTEIQGIPCTGWNKKPIVSFFPDGKLKTCRLSKKYELDGTLLKKHTLIHFDQECQCYKKKTD